MNLKNYIKKHNVKKKIKKYLKLVKIDKDFKTENIYPNKIWTMWLQGYDVAPPIIRACIDSIKKFSNGREVIVLDEKNMQDFVEIPDYILKKYKKGYIGHAHFSDFIRTLLLAKYGGTWMDSTIYCTDYFDELTSSEFMILQNPISRGVSNFFIHSSPNHILIKYMLKFLLEYWKREKKAVDYFFWHKFFVQLVKNNSDCKKAWEEIPIYSNVNPHMLIREVGTELNLERIKYLKRLTPIHKLTYKKKVELVKVDLSNIVENSYWNEIIKEHK